MDCLPEEIIVYILAKLDETKDVLNFSLTQKRHNSIVMKNKDVFSCMTYLSDEILNEMSEMTDFLSNSFGRVNIKTSNYDLVVPFIENVDSIDLSYSEIEDVSMFRNAHSLNLTGCQRIKDVSILAPKCRVTFSAEHPCGQERSSCGAKRMH